MRRALLSTTTTLGLREHPVTKTALARDHTEVRVRGQRVRVKRGHLDGTVITETPEWEDVAAAARVLGLPERVVIDAARTAAAQEP